MTGSPEQMNCDGVAEPEEMRDAGQWLASMLAALTAVEETRDARDAQPEITCFSQGWGTLQLGLCMDKTPLCLAGTRVH